jgi:ABC-type transport system involved in multi-copper enzyme maturation permease subunit
MFWQILGFEIRYQLRRPATWLYFAILFLLAFGFLSSDAVELGGGRGKVLKNAPYVLAQATMILSAIGQVITSALVGTAILRDYQNRTHELLFTTAMSRGGYLAGRFVGASVAMLLVYLAIPLGAMVGSVMPWVDAAKMHPIHVVSYLQPFLVFGVTNVLFVSALFFAAGALTRSQFVVYTMGIFLLVFNSIAGQLTKDLRNDWAAALSDPFGFGALRLATRYWTVAERNTLLVPLDGFVLWNRVTWALVAVALVGITFWLFRFSAQPIAFALPWRRARLATAGGGTLGGGAVGGAAGGVPHDDHPGALDALLLPAAAPDAGARVTAAWDRARDRATGVRQLWAVTRLAFAGMARQVTFLAIATVGTVNVVMTAWFAGRSTQEVVLPRTYLIADAVVNGFGLFFVVLLTMYVGELVWRERSLRTDQIQDALPVSPTVHLVGRALGLLGVMAVLQLVLILAGMAVQTVRGYHEYELLVYLRTVFLVEFPFVLQYALFAFLVHTVVNNRSVGNVVLIAFWVLMITLDAIGFEHLLYQFGRTAPYTYSDMNGYGHFVPRLATFIGYWTAMALVMGVLAALAWVRGTGATRGTRLTDARARFGPRARLALGAAGGATAAFGGFAFYNTNVLHTYAGKKSRNAYVAGYEKKYRARFDGVELPKLAAVDVDADLQPERRAYLVRGTHTYVNRSGRPLDSLILSFPSTSPGDAIGVTENTGRTPEMRMDSLVWSRPARELLMDRDIGFAVWRLDAPLAPGDSVRLRYVRRYEALGFPNGAFNTRVVENGTFVADAAPIMGYSREQELPDDDDRKKVGLKPRALTAPRDSAGADRVAAFGREGDWIRFRATVRTAPDQIAIAPGYLESAGTENGRRVFRYAMDAPMANMYAFNSARYEVRRATWRGPVCAGALRDGCVPRDTTVGIEVYYHKGHEYNVERMIRSVQRSLDYFTRSYGPYQHRQVRIIEFPRYASFAQSFPNTIPYSEGIGFISELKDDKGRDMPFQVTSHEVAHQWWGHQVLPADVQGSTMIVESLAEFSSMMVVEKEYGRHAMEKYMNAELDWYLRGRGTEAKRELPLALVEGQGYIRYGKGGLTLYALRDYIGEEAMNRALASYVRKASFQRGPYTTTRDLIAELRAVTPDSLQYLVGDLFETITLWDLKTEDATATRRPDGRWAVRVQVAAKKVRADTAGAEREVPMADHVTIGLFGAKTDTQDRLGAPLYLGKHRVTGRTAVVDLVVDRKPETAAVDPYHLLIDRDPKDNVRDVVAGAASGARPAAGAPNPR